MVLVSEHMPLLERLRKAANCVVFLDGAPEPAADVADMLRKAADEIESLKRREDDLLKQVERLRTAIFNTIHDLGHKGPNVKAVRSYLSSIYNAR